MHLYVTKIHRRYHFTLVRFFFRIFIYNKYVWNGSVGTLDGSLGFHNLIFMFHVAAHAPFSFQAS